MSEAIDGRRYVSEIVVRLERDEGGGVSVLAPMPGYFRDAPRPGALISPGAVVGVLEVLGVQHRLRAPDDAFGRVVESRKGLRREARRPVEYGETLLALDPDAVRGEAHAAAAREAAGSLGPVFKSPLGGRYYARPGPEAAPFLEVGRVVTGGETVAIVEVMKTFNRVQYDGPRAKVTRIVPSDGDDIDVGAVILELASDA